MEKEEPGGGGGGSTSIVSSSFVTSVAAAGSKGISSSSTTTTTSRQRFTVELRPGETTFVSWKKLIKDANKANPTPPPPLPPPALEAPPTGAHPALESRIAPGQPTDCELKDEPPSNRFSAVIEKIERLYMGKQSSDEEELDDVPDDDQYDTEDSFIDDAELDQYFQVDKSTTKHNGFFVNKGKLERTNEPVSSPNQQPKKRRRKDTTKDCGERDAEHVPTKQAKLANVRMKAAARTAPFVSSKASSPSHKLATASDHFQEGKSQNQLHDPIGPIRKKLNDSKSNLERSSSPKLQVKDDSGFVEAKDTDKLHSRDSGNKKVASKPTEATHQMHRDSSASIQHEHQSRKILTPTNELEPAVKLQQRGKNGSSTQLEYPIRTVKNEKSTSMHVKEGSSVRSKGTMLERAIRELETIVSESRPQTMEIHDADTSSQGIKRRLPREVKQKLAKVARLAQSSQGKISEELIHRLMSILGHTVQLKTLKRNLKAMVELGLSAKQEKDDRFQQIKNEVIEMIKTQAASSKNKTIDQRDGTFDDFRELVDSEEKGHLKGKFSMDNAMEDKICDLYDLYVEGMDEDKGPQIRKLYVELAELWPNGLMDNHGIKNAVCRAKERKRAHYGRLKEKEKIKRRKLSSASRTEEIGCGEASSVAQPRVMVERMASENNRGLLSPNKTSTNLTTSNQQSSERLSNSNVDWLKQEKIKNSSSTFLDKARKTLDGVLVKKKVKRKPESDSGDMKYPPEKLSLQQAKERQKSKQATGFPQKSSLQSHSLQSQQPI